MSSRVKWHQDHFLLYHRVLCIGALPFSSSRHVTRCAVLPRKSFHIPVFFFTPSQLHQLQPASSSSLLQPLLQQPFPHSILFSVSLRIHPVPPVHSFIPLSGVLSMLCSSKLILSSKGLHRHQKLYSSLSDHIAAHLKLLISAFHLHLSLLECALAHLLSIEMALTARRLNPPTLVGGSETGRTSALPGTLISHGVASLLSHSV